jgi:hypothetical protein
MILEISCARAVSPRSRPRTRCSEVLISREFSARPGALSAEISWTEELPMTCATEDPNQAPEDIQMVDIAGRTIVVIAT